MRSQGCALVLALRIPRRGWEREEVFVTPIENGIVLSKDPVSSLCEQPLLVFLLAFLVRLGLFGLSFRFGFSLSHDT